MSASETPLFSMILRLSSFGRCFSLRHAVGMWVAVLLLAASSASCRDRRALEEINQTLAGGFQPPPPTADLDPLRLGILRMERLWVRGGERIMEELFEVAPGQPHHHPLTLEAGECLALYAFGEGSGEPPLDLDLELQNPDGWPVAFERALDAFPVSPDFCAQTSGVHTLVATAYRGQGRAMMAAARLSDAEWSQKTQQLRALINTHAPGFTPEGAPQSGFSEQGYAGDVPLALTAGRCYAVVAVADTGIGDIDLDLIGRDERSVRRDIGTDPTPVILPFCPEQSGIWRLKVRMYQGGGRYWWQLFSAAPPSQAVTP
jgi:hypothetical protein